MRKDEATNFPLTHVAMSFIFFYCLEEEFYFLLTNEQRGIRTRPKTNCFKVVIAYQ